MTFAEPLIPARLTRRYKRFLADCIPETGPSAGQEITAHVANPGSMLGLAEPGMRVWLEPNDDPKRKLKFAWRLVDHENGHFTGVDTGVPNRLIKAALMAHQIEGLPPYDLVRPEVKYGTGSRIDFLLSGAQDTYVEVKSITLSRQPGLAEFPDSVTARGAKHLGELALMAEAGHGAVLLFVVQRSDCSAVTLADDLDPAYARAFADAQARGVQVLVLGCALAPSGITLAAPLPFFAPGDLPRTLGRKG